MRTLLLLAVLAVAGCGPDESEAGDRDLNVKWEFLSGDCASNMVDQVKVTWGPSGMLDQEATFACSAGQGKLGQTGPMGGSYGITAVGLDSAGVARFTHFSTSLTVSDKGTHGIPVDLTLRPKPADVTVTWHFSNGSGCPAQVVLPYTIGVYNRPAMGMTGLGAKVKDTQESCSSKTATLESVTPGDYIVDLDSRAQSPMIKAQRQVTVKGGENLTVDIAL
ncbi:MAG: hypothetical protein JNM17_10140 [Archangium sp.]|nr:hypothetical protein [Archangium sp.]